MKEFVLFKNSLTNGLTWGIIGGLLFAFIHSFDPNISRETKFLIDFSFWLTFVIVSAMTLNLKNTDKKYFEIFTTTSVTFILIFSSNPIRLAIVNPFYRDEFSMTNFFMFVFIGLLLCGALTFVVTRRR